jgi:hypothetical protein
MNKKICLRLLALALALIFTASSVPLRSQAEDYEEDDDTSSIEFAEGQEFIGYIIKLIDGADADVPDGLIPIPYNEGMYVAETISDAMPLLFGGTVEFIVENAVIEPLGGEEIYPLELDPLAEQVGQWHLGFLNMYDVWGTYTETGSGVKIAVVDSGVTRAHEDLDYTYIGGQNFVNTIDPSGAAWTASVWNEDNTGHGTFVTGLIGAITDNDVGIKGIASKAELIEARCMASERTTVAEVIAAIGYAVDQGADVINMSLGGTNVSSLRTALQPPISRALEADTILIAAVGNRSDGDAILLPAGMDGVIGVGMLASDGVVSAKSTQNTSVDITAPGMNLVSLHRNVNGTTYASGGNGTSYAAPQIAALATLVRQVDGGIDGEEFLELLKESSVDGGEPGYDVSYGWGKADAYALMQTLETGRAVTYCTQDGTVITPESGWLTEYTIRRANGADYSLPVPEFIGADFIGWYDNDQFYGDFITEIPTGIISGLMLYAKTQEVADGVGILSVSVKGIAAEIGESNRLRVTVPANLTLSALTAADIAVTAGDELAEVSQPVTPDGGVTWTFTVTNGTAERVYTLTVVNGFAYAPEAVSPDELIGNGYAVTPASLDGATPAAAFTYDLTEAFSYAGNAEFTVVSGGSERLVIDGASLTYTPGVDDAGGTAEFTVTAGIPDGFSAVSNQGFAVEIGELPPSDSVILTTTASYDKRLQNASDIFVKMMLYGNNLLKISDNSAELKEGTDYIIDVVQNDEQTITIKNQYLKKLINGTHTLKFSFDASRTESGKNQTLTLTVSGGATGGSGGSGVPVPSPSPEAVIEEQGTGDSGYAVFTDVKESDWFCEDVDFAVRNGLMNGTGDGQFSPNVTMTRGMAVTVLHRIAGQPGASGNVSFADADSGKYYYAAVEWAAETGIVNGVGEDMFAPDAEISRQDLAVMLYKFAGGIAPNYELGFGDAGDISGYARDAIAWCAESGIIRGKDGNVFDPNGMATRAEVAAMMRRLVGVRR